MSYWSVARIQKESLALHCLSLAGYQTYLPRLRVHKMVRGRKIELRPALFPGYLFLLVETGWYSARWSPGVFGLIMDGASPARLPENAIAEIRKREVGGLIELARQGVKRGDRVKILRGPFQGCLAIYSNSGPRDRCEVLLRLLGGAQRVTMAALDVEPAK